MDHANARNPEEDDRGCMPCVQVKQECAATTGIRKGFETQCSSKTLKNRKKRLRKQKSKLRVSTDRTVSSGASELEGFGASFASPREFYNLLSASLGDTSSQVDSQIRFHTIPGDEGSAQSQPTCSCGAIPGNTIRERDRTSRKRMNKSSAIECRGEKRRALQDARDEGTYDYGVVPAHQPGQKVYIHGNYHRYYGYRLGGAFDQDPRLSVLEKGWFHKKRCLDIGCNEGLVTLGLAKAFGTTSMTGIDLDEHLIKRACAHLKEERSAAINEFVLSQQAGTDSSTRKSVRRKMQSLAQTWFVHGNVLASRIEKGTFDCITAFSVTKWIHLHGGDRGIRFFFSKVRDLLAPGGKFIVEPQSWKSYKSAANKMKRNKLGSCSKDAVEKGYFFRLDEIKLRPEDFCTILPREYGLKFIRQLCPPAAAAEGFDRGIYMFQKL